MDEIKRIECQNFVFGKFCDGYLIDEDDVDSIDGSCNICGWDNR